MAEKDRIANKNYTCRNIKFQTDTRKGHPHGSRQVRGSVFKGPLCKGENGYTLWLEHVTNLNDSKDQCYWLMWYQDGIPTIPLSGIMHRKDIINMVASFADEALGSDSQTRAEEPKR